MCLKVGSKSTQNKKFKLHDALLLEKAQMRDLQGKL
jgi:hypothetical protein